MTEDKNNIVMAVVGFCVRTMINLFLIYLLVEGFTGAYFFSYKLFADAPYVPGSDSKYDITISEGTTPKELGLALEAGNIVESDELFLARVYLGRYSTKIRAGSYTLSPAMSPDQICKIICGIEGGGT